MPDFNEPIEEKMTQWKNPLDVEQFIDVRYGDEARPTRFRWKPGETNPVPSRFDRAIHRVHNGVIIGGLAPQLVRIGASEKLDPALDTEAVKKKEAEVQAAIAVVAKKTAEEAIVTAAARQIEADRAIEAKQAGAEKSADPKKLAKAGPRSEG